MGHWKKLLPKKFTETSYQVQMVVVERVGKTLHSATVKIIISNEMYVAHTLSALSAL